MSSACICSSCKKTDAAYFCSCNLAEAFFCSRCNSHHITTEPKTGHQTIPIAAYSPDYFRRVTRRRKALETGKALLAQSVQSIDNCIQEFTQQMNDVVAVLWEYGQQRVSELEQAKSAMERQVSEAVDEAERLVWLDSPLAMNKITMYLRSEELMSKLQLCAYRVKPNLDVVKTAVTVDYIPMYVSEPVGWYCAQDGAEGTMSEAGCTCSSEPQFTAADPAFLTLGKGSRNWQCTNCGGANPVALRDCQHCAKPRPS